MANNVTPEKNILNDFLNAGLGLLKDISKEIENRQKEILDGYNNLIAKGALEKSEFAESLRRGLSEGIQTLNNLGLNLSSKPTLATPSARQKLA